jgi:hypothetical protein
MNRAEYRQKLRELHPDLNGGNHSAVTQLMQVQQVWREQNTVCRRAGCNRNLTAAQVKKRGEFCGVQCRAIAINKQFEKPKKLKQNL